MNLKCFFKDHLFDLTPQYGNIDLTCKRCKVPFLSGKAGYRNQTMKAIRDLNSLLMDIMSQQLTGEQKNNIRKQFKELSK